VDALPPDPVASYDDLSVGLQRVRVEAGVSYRELHRRIARDRRRRGIPEVPAYDTVYRCLQTGRTRLDVDLVIDIVRALGADAATISAWRAAWAAAARRRLEAPTGAAAPLRDIRAADAVRLVGRGEKLARLLDRPGRWLVTGMPGVGKSVLAMTAAVELVRSGRADGALRIQLDADADHPAPTAATVTEALLLRLGATPEAVVGTSLVERGALIAQRLVRQRVVLLLDDCGDPDQLGGLPAAASGDAGPGDEVSGTWLMVTSRRRLDLPDAGIVELGPLAPVDGLAVIDQISAVDGPAARRLVELTGGLPLALVLTRARIAARPDWSLTDHADQIAELQRSGRLDDGLDASLALSYADLPAEESRIFRLLGALPCASMTSALLAPVLGVTDPEPTLVRLRDRSLLQSAGAARYALHDVVRVYAAARRLEQDPPSVRRADLNRLLDVQAAATGAAMARFSPHEVHRQPALPPIPPGITFSDDDAAARWLDDERTNLLQAVGYAQRHPGDHDRPRHVVRMSLLLFRFLDLAGWYDDAERLHGWAAAVAEDADDRARTLNQWGITAWSSGRLAEAEQRMATALEIYRSAGDLDGEGRVLVNLGGVSRDRGDTAAALGYGYRALELAALADDPASRSAAHTNLGVAHEQAEEHADALSHHRAALDIARDLGDRFGEARALSNIADILLCLGEHDEARRLQSECLELARVLHFDQAIADSLNNLATLDSLAGRHAAAIAGHREALAVAERRGLGADVITRQLAASRERARTAGEGR
jgi:tetratricopeptide (TPR) repeat protein